MEFSDFKVALRDAVRDRFNLSLRHDIVGPEGSQTHGWKHIALLSPE